MSESNQYVLKKLAVTYLDSKAAYQDAARDYIRSLAPLPVEAFDALVPKLADAIRNTLHHGRADVERGVEHFIYDHVIRGAYVIGGDKTAIRPNWGKMACFLARYVELKDRLSKHCFNMPGVEKGDDGYGDWIDALPLAGEHILNAIWTGTTYSNLKEMLSGDSLSGLILNGENYISMRLEDNLIERLANIERHDESPVGGPPKDSDEMTAAAAFLRDTERVLTTTRETLVALRQAADRAESAVTQAEQTAEQAGEQARAVWKREKARRDASQGEGGDGE
jgi:hypothetical protein